MNKQEAIKRVEELYGYGSIATAVTDIISQIDQPQKVVVPKVALEYYEMLKGNSLSLSEWFDEMYVSETKDDFPKITLLQEWVHGNDFEKNREREMALATLFINGPKSVEVEKEQLYTVEIPDPNRPDIATFLYKENGKVFIGTDIFLAEVPNYKWKNEPENQLTESEIKEDFEWAWQFREEVD
ncbi:DUF1642 domain-containing protein [Streptococcus suis]|nr:DUF1642 domain-containing protein [Streptococcus suis]HEM6349207.1 DUF1642 domain-containing protein [Streptococcus suis]